MADVEKESLDVKIVEVAIAQVKGFFYPSEAERAAAYELLVELTTRPSSAQLAATDATIGDELQSVEEMFDITREILRRHGTGGSKGSAGNLSLAVVALRVLNEVFRPVVNRWRPLLDEHLARRPADDLTLTPAEWERRWERSQQCRTELNEMRASTRAYIETLSHIAGTPAIADAILSGPSATMFPRSRIESSLHPTAPVDGITPRRKMVRWLDFGELWTTYRSGAPAKKSLKRADEREPVVEFDERERMLPDARFTAAPGAEFWFDYVADMGDGFDGTAPVAWLLGRHSISLPDHRSNEIPTPPAAMPRGELVVFGGDEVYPFAAPGVYESQLELPYRMGLEGGPDGSAPTLVAIPGNHDWLGGIEHFERIFVSGRDFADHWKTVQRNTWWHVALPQGWWLWGIDTGLHDHLVGPQEEYFRKAAESLRLGDRVILVTPVPLWQMRLKKPEAYEALRATFDPIITAAGATMPLCLSGDTHMFAHLERVDTDQCEEHITAGGGGAFLQPTHNLPERVPLERGNAEFKLTSRWPLPADSRAIAPSAARIYQPQYWGLIVIAALLSVGYSALVQARPIARSLEIGGSSDLGAESADELNWIDSLLWSLMSPTATALLVAIALIGVVAFRGNTLEPKLTKGARAYGLVAGAGMSATFLLVNTTRLDLADFATLPTLAVSIVVALVTGIASIWVFLTVVRWANRRIKANDTLSFNQAHSTRYKHFLRFRIDQDGDLTCYVVGIDPVGRGWYEAMTPEPGSFGSVPPYDPAGGPQLHYVWGRKYEKFVPSPVRVALSISDPEASTDTSLVDAFEGVAKTLLDGGHTIMYGGMPDAGYTERLHEIDRARHSDNPNAEPHLVNYVADFMWDQARADAMADRVRSIRVRRHQVGTTVGGAPGWEPPEVGSAAADADSQAAEVARVIGDLTAMRRVMTDHADIRVVIGGALQPGRPGTRLAPGILEEAYLAAEAGRALLVAGGFGGAGALIADAILGRLDPRTVDDLAAHFVTPRLPGVASFADMLLRFRSLGVLRNGLTDGENVELLRSSDVATVSSLILRSVHRIGAGRTL